MKLPHRTLLLAATTLAAASSAFAATALKNVIGTDLTAGASWITGAPTSSDTASWDTTSLGAGLTVGSAVAWGDIAITGAQTNVAITGAGAITTGNITLSGTQTLSIANAIALSGNSIYNIANVTGSTATDATLSGSISGASRSITKSGAGKLMLSASNSFNGGISVTGGELYLTSASGIGSNAITLSGNSTLTGENHGGTVSSFGTGLITVSAGQSATIALNQQNAVTQNNYQVNGSATFKADNIGVGGVYFGYHNNTTYTVSGTGPITLQDTSVGGGALYWSLNCTGYTGAVSIADGSEVVLFNGSTLGSGAVTLGATTTLRRSGGANITVTDLSSTYSTATVNDSTVIINSVNGSTYAGKISGGTLTKNGAGTLTLSGANNHTGGTTVNAGTLLASSSGALGTGLTTVAGGALNTAVANVTSGGLTLNNATSVLTLNGTTAGSITLAAGANLAMSAGTWNIALASGMDTIVGSGAGTFNLAGATLNLGGGAINYGTSYNLLSGFASGNAAGLGITGYDTVNYLASMNNAGTLSFAAIPEPSTYGLLGAGALAAVSFVRRRRRDTTA